MAELPVHMPVLKVRGGIEDNSNIHVIFLISQQKRML